MVWVLHVFEGLFFSFSIFRNLPTQHVSEYQRI